MVNCAENEIKIIDFGLARVVESSLISDHDWDFDSPNDRDSKDKSQRPHILDDDDEIDYISSHEGSLRPSMTTTSPPLPTYIKSPALIPHNLSSFGPKSLRRALTTHVVTRW